MSQFEEDTRYFDEIEKLKVKCNKCGHIQTVFGDKDICNNCGYYIYRNKKLEFLEQVKTKIKK